MKPLHFKSSSYDETLALAAKFAKVLKGGDVVCLFGELGSGKTAFVKGLVKGLKMPTAHVHSPTFTLMNIYDGKLPLYHFDLYRIAADDLFNLGYEEFFYGHGVAAVEWSERLGSLAPGECWNVELKHAGDDKRELRISINGDKLAGRFGRLGHLLK